MYKNIWICLAEVAAERRDAKTFGRIVCAVPALARAAPAVTAGARADEVEYFARHFDDIVFGAPPNARVRYLRNGILHRKRAPAIMYANGCAEWYCCGQLHRDNGPAVVAPGTAQWFCHGRLHRTDGPAFESGVVRKWFQHGLLHRVSGPAIIRRFYYSSISTAGEMEIHGPTGARGETGPTAPTDPRYYTGPNNQVGTHSKANLTGRQYIEEWYTRGRRHRSDGPAVDNPDGTFEWWFEGELHRVGGPAVRKKTCDEWYQSGQLHRADGPAIEHRDGGYAWFLHGVQHRIGGPAFVGPNNNMTYEAWYEHGELHREDGPAHNGIHWYFRGFRVYTYGNQLRPDQFNPNGTSYCHGGIMS